MPPRLGAAFAAVGCLAATVACGSSPPAGLAPFPAVVRVYYDNSGGLADSLHTVIRQDVDFQRLWQQATSRQTSPPPPPPIDFAQEMVIAVGAGRLTSDDRIQVDSVGVSEEMNPGGRSEETLNVFVSVVLACQRFDIEGFPLEIVRLRRFDGPVRFHDQRRQAENCLGAPGPGGS